MFQADTPLTTLQPHMTPLTDVRGDDSEGTEVSLGHILCQGSCILLEVPQQLSRATLCLLDQLPVPLVPHVQQRAAHPQQVLGARQW